MMHAVVRRPPQHALLARTLRQHRHRELEEAIQLVGAMAEITMVAGRDPKHAHHVHNQHEREILPAEGNEKHSQHCQVQGCKGRDGAKLIVTNCLIQIRTRVQSLRRCLPKDALEEYAQLANLDFQLPLYILADG